MDTETVGVPEPASGIRREVGRFGGTKPGPTLIVVGGIHGNEPAGVEASRRVLARLRALDAVFLGEIVFLAGNLTALGRGVRYVDLDFNRIWTADRVERVRADGPRDEVEEREMRSLIAVIDDALGRVNGEAYLFDLHTSSAPGCPFMTVGDTMRNREFASRFPLPLILGLEEQIDGALLEYLNNRGLVTLGIEGGQHDAAESVDHFESMLWCAMVEAGQIGPGSVPALEKHRAYLRAAARNHPRVIEVRHRHAVRDGDEFRMEPGFKNFQPIHEGQLLARDRTGDLRSPEDGRMLLPLYQGMGDDGFFVARDVRPIWMRVSRILRKWRVGGLMPVLPGVRRDPAREGVLVIDTRVARLFPMEILHLLGFRKLRHQEGILEVSRRRHDFEPPARYV